AEPGVTATLMRPLSALGNLVDRVLPDDPNGSDGRRPEPERDRQPPDRERLTSGRERQPA
ncbi:MAG TPA: hypothetical protein VEY67_00875, partial [Candidatus Dormibacteraeota bacterium]|nr:hypothetical protein [Candidatus Dormibacteraeota bacterium]